MWPTDEEAVADEKVPFNNRRSGLVRLLILHLVFKQSMQLDWPAMTCSVQQHTTALTCVESHWLAYIYLPIPDLVICSMVFWEDACGGHCSYQSVFIPTPLEYTCWKVV